MDAREELRLINYFISTSQNLPVQHKQVSVIGDRPHPVMKAKGCVIRGLVSSTKYLARENGDTTHLLGRDILENSLVSQWMEYRITSMDRCVGDKELASVLSDLNSWLSDKSYFIGNLMTLADVLIFYKLHSVFKLMSFQDKQRYINLSRWFKHLQSMDHVRQDLDRVSFMVLHTF